MQTFHLQLIKGRSYTGIVSATRKKPDVYTDDEKVAKAAEATGYFKIIEVTEVKPIPVEKTFQENPDADTIEIVPTAFGVSGEPTDGHLDYTSLMSMTLDKLKDMADKMEVDITGLRKKSEIAKAISAVEVGIPTEGSEADFSEE